MQLTSSNFLEVSVEIDVLELIGKFVSRGLELGKLCDRKKEPIKSYRDFESGKINDF